MYLNKYFDLNTLTYFFYNYWHFTAIRRFSSPSIMIFHAGIEQAYLHTLYIFYFCIRVCCVVSLICFKATVITTSLP